MKYLNLFLLCLLVIFAPSLWAQSLFTNTNVQQAFKNGTRTRSGKPGIHYWQNSANYRIKVHFDPSTQLLEGSEMISYVNNSPDSLKEIIIRLYPDLYKRGVSRSSQIDEKDLGEGVQIESFSIGGEVINPFDEPGKAYRKNTLLFIQPSLAIAPHGKAELKVSWNYRVNTGSPVRTGMVDSTSYFIAYFFPRISVYDDIDGWDDWSYNGSQEFYNDFGNFDVEITVPEKYIVWATGDRQDAAEHFSDRVLKKIQLAATSDPIVAIIDSTDYGKADIFKVSPSDTWKFKADHVTDFAFALSDHYLWDASSVMVDSLSKRRTLASAVYNKVHKDYYEVADQAHQTVYYTSFFYPKYPFPFSHITVFDGTEQMEYPMMVNDNPTPTRTDAVQLTTHEIFHSYFPFLMGINETQYAWMDEGWATIGESVISPKMGEPEAEGIFSKTRFERISGTDLDVPLITNTKNYEGAPSTANSYGKGGVCYYVLQDLLGDELYFKCLHRYMDDWKGKHPTPYDFFYSFNSAAGRSLDWFWQKWFFGWDYPDLSISGVVRSGENTKVSIENKGGLPLPVYLTLIAKNGTSKVVHFSTGIWKEGKREMEFQVSQPFDDLSRVVLGNIMIPDKYTANNEWKKNP